MQSYSTPYPACGRRGNNYKRAGGREEEIEGGFREEMGRETEERNEPANDSPALVEARGKRNELATIETITTTITTHVTCDWKD